MMDVVVVGAGVSGLAAASELVRAGLDIICVEARNRIGGRILTAHQEIAVELGAEFIHGKPPQIQEIVKATKMPVIELDGDPVHVVSGRAVNQGGGVDHVLDDLSHAAANDRTFAEFMEQGGYSDEDKRWSAAYIEGFHAADRHVIGIASIAQENLAAHQIDGDRSFRLLNGYDGIPLFLANGVPLRLNARVDRIVWKRGDVAVHTGEVLHGRRVLITVPLGVLQQERIRFEPEPARTFGAVRALRFGHVFRVTLRFKSAFWRDRPEFRNASFFFSDEPVFPTWWTIRPLENAYLTGWSAGPAAESLIGLSSEAVVERALASLERIMGMTLPPVEQVFFHDWQADPFAEGAYSYTPAGGMWAHRVLAEPVEDTLYFAGEATETEGHSGTVHGAIATGRRAARQILDAL